MGNKIFLASFLNIQLQLKDELALETVKKYLVTTSVQFQNRCHILK